MLKGEVQLSSGKVVRDDVLVDLSRCCLLVVERAEVSAILAATDLCVPLVPIPIRANAEVL